MEIGRKRSATDEDNKITKKRIVFHESVNVNSPPKSSAPKVQYPKSTKSKSLLDPDACFKEATININKKINEAIDNIKYETSTIVIINKLNITLKAPLNRFMDRFGISADDYLQAIIKTLVESKKLKQSQGHQIVAGYIMALI